MDIKVISLEESAFYELINRVVADITAAQGEKALSKWVDGQEAMKILRITSKTTLQKLRDEGKIRFSPILPKHFLYDTDSITAYIEKHAQETF